MKLFAVFLAALAFFSVERVQAAPAPDSFPGCVYQASPPTLTDLNASRLNCDTAGALKISGNITSSSAAVGLTGSAVPTSADFVGGNKSGNLTGLTLDASGYLNINCQTGCAGGSFNNNTDAVATSSTNGQNASWLYGFNGTTWDRLRVDGSKNLEVNINASSVTVPVSGTFWQTTQPVSISGVIALPSGASTSANQTNGSQKTKIVDGSGNVIASTSNALNVSCAACAATAATDETTFTPAVTSTGTVGGFFQTTATNNPLTNLQQGMAQLTAYRSLMVNLRDASGQEEGLSGQPLQVSLANTGANATPIIVAGAGTAGTANSAVVTIQGIASMTPVIVTGSGSAGTAAAGVATIQGIASMTPVLTNPGTAASWSLGATAAGVPANATYVGANQSGNLVAPLLDASGFLEVNVEAGGGTGGTSSNFAGSFPGTGTAIGVKNGANMVNLVADGSSNLLVNCAAGCSGTATVDATTFIPGVTNTGTSGGFFQTTATNNALTNLQQGMVQMTANRAFMVNLRSATGAEEGSAAAPLQVSLANTGVNGTPVSISLAASTVAAGAYVAGSFADGAVTTLGAKADAKNAATDTTAITVMQVLKEISSLEQAPASRAVTNVGTFATQSAITAASGSIASGALASGSIASGAVASGAVASGAFASGALSAGAIADGGDTTLGSKADAKSTATDTTAITAMQVFKEISAMEQAPASRAVTNAGTFADQATLQTQTDTVMVGGVNVKEINAVTPLMGNGTTGTGSQRVTIASDNTAFAVNGTLQTQTDTIMVGGVNVKEINAVTPLMGNGTTGTGSLRVTVASDNTAFSVNGTLQTQTDTVMVGGVNVKEINAVAPLMGNGTTGTGSLRVTVASDNTAFAVNAQPSPTTAGGLTFYILQPAASDNHAVIKAGAGQVYHITVMNNSATVNYLRLYNATTGFSGCNSATNLQWDMVIPASTSGAGFVEDISQGIAFATGISICVTSGYATTDTTNATATAMTVNIGYK